MKDFCTWTESDQDWGLWKSECGDEIALMDIPSVCGVRYCAFCSKPIREVPTDLEEYL